MEEKTIEFHYLKPPDYRTFHVDGAIGGPTPSGGLSVSFFVERSPIPQNITYELKNGQLGGEVRRSGKVGVIRELDCGIVLTLPAAKTLHSWLTKQILALESKKNAKKDK